MLISVHIPKTGGSTFGGILKENFGENLYLDYADRPMTHGTLVRNLMTIKSAYSADINLKSYLGVHGHFLPYKYSKIKDRSMAVWLRNPIDRVVSRYHHMQRNLEGNPEQFKKYIKHADISLMEFCEIKQFHNLYDKYLWGTKIESFDFIGITENYDQCLAAFCEAYSIDRVESRWANKNTLTKKIDGRYEVDEKTKNLIYRTNRKDFALYEKARSISSNKIRNIVL